MLIDAIPFRQVFATKTRAFREDIIRRIVMTIESKLHVQAVYDAEAFPAGDPRLAELSIRANELRASGILERFWIGERLADEPPMISWYGTCGIHGQQVGGSSFRSPEGAFTAMLSEALERTIWSDETDYFAAPQYATTAEIARAGAHIAPERFVSFTEKARAGNPAFDLRTDAAYLWIRGTSLITNDRVYLPAQTASGAPFATADDAPEPLIRDRNTNGLATAPTNASAELAGILELLERDAYMITWLNQLSCSRISLASLVEKFPELEPIFENFARYRLRVHLVRMATDAPTHAICAVLEDESGLTPKFAIGLKAGHSLPQVIEKALTEALRARTGVRNRLARGVSWNSGTKIREIGHRERLDYWADPENAQGLAFLAASPEEPVGDVPWEGESDEKHRARLLAWCRTKGYECVAVPLTNSARNPTDLAVVQVIMPDLQPTYLHEARRHFDGRRLREVPQSLGLSAREPFGGAPHPFS